MKNDLIFNLESIIINHNLQYQQGKIEDSADALDLFDKHSEGNRDIVDAANAIKEAGLWDKLCPMYQEFCEQHIFDLMVKGN